MRRWALTALFALVAVGSVAILIFDHSRVESALEATVAATDNLTQARLHVAQALLFEERLRAGDPTLVRLRPLAELDQALALLDDLIAGRSSVLGMTPGLPEPSLLPIAASYIAELESLRRELADGRYEEEVASRVRISRIEAMARRLEGESYDALGRRLAREDERHRVRVTAWLAFLLATGTAFVVVRTSRDRSESARHAAESRYAALATHAAATLVRTDEDGRVVETTDERNGVFGEGTVAPMGHYWWNSLPQGEGPRAADLWLMRSGRRQAFFLEMRYETADGATKWLGSRWVRDCSEGDGSGASWIGTFIDETEERVVEDQLRQAQRLESMGRLAGGIAHDFNNLLAVILSNVTLLERDVELGPHARELVAEVETAARSGRDLVAGLTGFSRKSGLEMEPLDLGGAVRETAKLARRLLPESMALRVRASEEEGPWIHGDRRALQQILLNLVSNARDAVSDAGVISVEVDAIDIDEAYRDTHPWMEPGHFGRITVSDTGTGMDSATLARVFDPFFTTKEEGRGTGLGLASVHGLVRQHGGHVHAYSEVGVGSTFRVYIPRVAAARVAAKSSSPDLSSDVLDRKTYRVLLVDDDEALRRAASRLLVRLGHAVVPASSGTEALALLEGGGEFDLVISDIMMAGMGGLALFESVRDQGREVGFIFTSGHSLQEAMEGGRLPEGSIYIAKPWTVDDLNRAISGVVG